MLASHFAPWTPGPGESFDSVLAAHLLRRAGFGASPEEVQQAVDQGLEATVEGYFADTSEEDADYARVFDSLAGSIVDLEDPGAVQAWWIHRMVHTRHPLREKLTLFWHGHFATNYNKVGVMPLMQRQLETLRAHAWGDFPDLVLAMARDPAMLIWLDGQTNTKEHPNENFARELMELFTCGIGNYAECDILEAARAFSGWHREGAEFVFHAEEHDFDRKTILGRSGRFDGGDVVDILMQVPATPRFMAGKLLRFFAGEPAPDVLDEAARLLDSTQLNIKWFLRELFLSRHFHSEACLRKRIASPAEYVIGTVRTLGIRVPAAELRDRMTAMGQELFAPPNVKGWDGEQKWINSATWPARVAFAQDVSQLDGESPFGRRLPLEATVPLDLTEPEDVVARLDAILMQGGLDEGVRAALRELLVTTDDGAVADTYRGDEGVRYQRNREALATILSLPEYHAI